MTFEARVLNEVDHGSDFWKTLRVGVFEIDGSGSERLVGEYERNYPSLFRTFVAFRVGSKAVALYSPDYTATRIMQLPDCSDLGGEEPLASGFCPVDYYVPTDEDGVIVGQFGFVAGCVWGDDSSWKIQILDLARVDEGRLIRDERLGHLELIKDTHLADVVAVHRYHSLDDREGYWAEIRALVRRDLPTGEPLASHDVD